jgi:hypothetical protein
MAPVRMKPLAVRWLTQAEQALARQIFGGGIRPERVRIFAQPLPMLDRSFTPGSAGIVYPVARSLVDFTEGALPDRATFVHELTHVWQAQHGVILPLAKLQAGDGPKSYVYDLDRQTFPEMNIEQQAALVEDHYVLQHQPTLLGETRPPRFPRERLEAQRPFWRQA